MVHSQGVVYRSFADSLELDNLKMEQNKKFILSNEARDFSNLNPRRLGVIEYADRYCGAAASASMDIPITQSTKIITPLEETVQILLPSACMKVVN